MCIQAEISFMVDRSLININYEPTRAISFFFYIVKRCRPRQAYASAHARLTFVVLTGQACVRACVCDRFFYVNV